MLVVWSVEHAILHSDSVAFFAALGEFGSDNRVVIGEAKPFLQGFLPLEFRHASRFLYLFVSSAYPFSRHRVDWSSRPGNRKQA
jgi:hypothetical protein